jgi:hypothetical protein
VQWPQGVYSVTAKTIFQNTASEVGATIQGNVQFWWGQVVDFIFGVLNGLTGGGLFSAFPSLNGYVDTTSDAFSVGTTTGVVLRQALQVAAAILIIVAPTSALAFWVLTLNSALNIGNGLLALIAGDYAEAGWSFLGAVPGVLSFFSTCKAVGVLGPLLGRLAILSGTALGLAAGGSSLYSAYRNFTDPNGDPVQGVLDLLDAAAAFYAAGRLLSSSCFTAEMLVKWEDGKKCIAEIRVGDSVWSRDEFDPWGRPALKEVLAVFTRVAPIWHVKLRGQTIRTTDEHPFYVVDRDWIPVKHLKVGDLLLTDEGTLERVEGVEDSGKVETVYNFLVTDYHTYFVSATLEARSVWAHNANNKCGVVANKKAGDQRQEVAKSALQEKYPNARVESERYLRNANGKSVRDKVTGERRRLDHVVIQDGQVIASVEVTSPSAPKGTQQAKEGRVRRQGGYYIRDPKTREILAAPRSKVVRVDLDTGLISGLDKLPPVP